MLFQKSSLPVRICAYVLMGLAALFVCGYIANFYFSARSLELFSWYERPYASNTKLEPIERVRAGEPLVLNFFVEKDPVKCWAVYTNVMIGPVTYQFPVSRNQNLDDGVGRLPQRLFYEVPRGLPVGDYTIHQLVFPTCTGRPVKPYGMDTGIKITVIDAEAPAPVVLRVERDPPLDPDYTIYPDENGVIAVTPSR